MITARDMALPAAFAPVQTPAEMPRAASAIAMPLATGRISGREKLLRQVLFVTMLLSCVAMIEPSPHDYLMGLLFFTSLIAGVTFERLAIPLFLLLLLWNIGGLISLTNVTDNPKAFTYTATTVYLSLAAVLFACLFAQNTLARLAITRITYIAGAVICSVTGIAGYFHKPELAGELFTLYDRADGFFKDPNVFSPFLIWPMLMLVARMLLDCLRIRDVVLLGVLVIGLFLSLSRGAWVHFAVSGAVMLLLLFVTSRSQRFRIRLIGMSAIGLFIIAGLIVMMLSISTVRTMFLERANALNYYDVGQGGRFQLQELAIGALLDFPFGMGPLEFARVYGLQQHNVYLQAFVVYGWLGGIAYVMMVLVTLLLGLRTALVATPWQTYAIVTFAVFVGEAGEGMVIDTDHWRHYFLLLGMIWGMAAATRAYMRNCPSVMTVAS